MGGGRWGGSGFLSLVSIVMPANMSSIVGEAGRFLSAIVSVGESRSGINN